MVVEANGRKLLISAMYVIIFRSSSLVFSFRLRTRCRSLVLLNCLVLNIIKKIYYKLK